MKTMEELTDMTRLKAIAGDRSIEVPEGLGDEVAARINAMSFLDENPVRKPRMIISIASVAASLAILMGIGFGSGWFSRQPKDTFTDPYLAYAELEEAFSLISSKMDKGLDMALQMETALVRTNEIMEKVN